MGVGDQKYTRLCPRCGAASVDYSTLSGGVATCRACGWEGREDALTLVPFDHMYGGDDGVANMLHGELRKLFSQQDVAVPLLRFLVRWGFVPVEGGRPSVKHTTRYLAAIALGLVNIVIAEREAIEREKANG